ncbi:MAG TPA: response regulator [Nitrospiraceae bacterium]|nr:response regulator [Nitrospiraceae bacterium]
MMTILAAVNDIFFYTKLRDALKPQGYQLERARSQQDLPDRIATVLPAAFVLDMNDPGLDGLKALEAIRTDARFKDLPILAFANHEEVGTWQEAKRLGVTRIVSRNEFSSRTRDLVTEIIASHPGDIQAEAPTTP